MPFPNQYYGLVDNPLIVSPYFNNDNNETSFEDNLFLLLDGSDFLLLDGTDFLLL